jgi:hypothetical protein
MNHPTTPAPDLTALADVHDAARAWMLHCLSYLDEVITLDCVVDTLLSDLAIGGFEITRATAPDAGRVTISRATVDRALRWADATPATDGTWTAEDRVAYGELLGITLAQAGAEGETK